MNLMASQIEIVSMIEKLGNLENITNPKTVQNINKALTELSRSSNPAIIQKVIAFKERMERNPIHQQIKAEEVAKVKEVETKAVEKREEDLQHRRAVNVERAREEKKDKEEKAKETDFKAMMNGFNALPVWRQLDILDKVFEKYSELNIDEKIDVSYKAVNLAEHLSKQGDKEGSSKILGTLLESKQKAAQEGEKVGTQEQEMTQTENAKKMVEIAKNNGDKEQVRQGLIIFDYQRFKEKIAENHQGIAENYIVGIEKEGKGYTFEGQGHKYILRREGLFDENGKLIEKEKWPKGFDKLYEEAKEKNLFIFDDLVFRTEEEKKRFIEEILKRYENEKENVKLNQKQYKNALDIISGINTLHEEANSFIDEHEKQGVFKVSSETGRKIFNDKIFSSLLKLDGDKVMTVHELVKMHIRGESNAILALPFIRELLEKGEHEKERMDLLKDILKNQWWGEEAASKIVDSLKRQVNSVDIEDKIKEAQQEMKAIDIKKWQENYTPSKTTDALLNFLQHDLVLKIREKDPSYQLDNRLDLIIACKKPEDVIKIICDKIREYGIEFKNDEELKKAFETYLAKTGIGNSDKQELEEVVDHVYESYLKMKEVGKVNVNNYEKNTQLKHEGGGMELAKLPDYIENAKNTMKDYPEYFTPHDPKEELKMENELEMERQNKAQNA